MKNNLIKLYTLAVYFCFTALMMAQPGEGGSGVEGGGNDNTGTAPIDDYVWVLGVAVLVYAFVKYSAMQKNSIKA